MLILQYCLIVKSESNQAGSLSSTIPSFTRFTLPCVFCHMVLQAFFVDVINVPSAFRFSTPPGFQRM